jgi:hypothetical protein
VKQTFGRRKLRSRTPERAYVELDWSLVGPFVTKCIGQDQIDNLPCRIAMQLQLGEDLPIDGPGDCVTQRLAIDRWWGLLGRLPRILSLSHIARLLKRPRRSRWLGWESGIFFDSLNYINPVFYERKSFTALPVGAGDVVRVPIPGVVTPGY